MHLCDAWLDINMSCVQTHKMHMREEDALECFAFLKVLHLSSLIIRIHFHGLKKLHPIGSVCLKPETLKLSRHMEDVSCRMDD